MNEAKALRALADKLDELEGLKAFPTDISEPGEVTVTWTEGQDHDGYATLSAAISSLVSQHWNALRSQVVKSKEGEVQAARAVWTGLSSSSTNADLSAAPSDVSVRKFG